MSQPTRYRVANNQAQLTLGGGILVVEPAGPLVEYTDYARLHSQFANSEQENARLKAEVERLKGIILAQSSEFVRNATKQEEEPLHDGWNTGIAKACDLLAEKDKEIERLKAEVERLRKAGDEMYMTLVDNNSHFEEVWRDKRIYAREAFQGWNHAKEGKPSV